MILSVLREALCNPDILTTSRETRNVNERVRAPFWLWLQLLTVVASLVEEDGLRGVWASVVVAHRL